MPQTEPGAEKGVGVVDPPEWPERPESAQDFDLFWLVRDLPPLPFPDESFDYGSHRAEFGPPGTRWIYSVAALAERETAPGVPDATKLAVNRLLAVLKKRSPPLGSAGWATPEPLAGATPPEGWDGAMPQSWIRTAITGTIGTDESFVHVMNWKHSTTENAPIGTPELQTVATAVRNAFQGFLAATVAGGPLRFYFTPNIRYREVRASALGQNAPAEKPTWGPQTVVSAFDANAVGNATSTASLPYEVSMGISLNTNWRGTGRFRSRLYLPPMTANVMATNGQFDPTIADAVGAAFGTNVVAGVATATDWELHVVSEKYGTSAAITGVRMGEVPDSQRRRRRNRPENYTQVWGTPVGGI